MTALCLLLLGLSQVQAAHTVADIANVSIPFGGEVEQPEQAHALIGHKIKTLAAPATAVGAGTIHLQSVAYTLTPVSGGYRVEGNVFIDIVPAVRTDDFVAVLGKKGIQANVSYYNRCIPLASR